MTDKAVVTQATLDAIGQAIIDKGGATGPMRPSEMAGAVASIPATPPLLASLVASPKDVSFIRFFETKVSEYNYQAGIYKPPADGQPGQFELLALDALRSNGITVMRSDSLLFADMMPLRPRGGVPEGLRISYDSGWSYYFVMDMTTDRSLAEMDFGVPLLAKNASVWWYKNSTWGGDYYEMSPAFGWEDYQTQCDYVLRIRHLGSQEDAKAFFKAITSMTMYGGLDPDYISIERWVRLSSESVFANIEDLTDVNQIPYLFFDPRTYGLAHCPDPVTGAPPLVKRRVFDLRAMFPSMRKINIRLCSPGMHFNTSMPDESYGYYPTTYNPEEIVVSGITSIKDIVADPVLDPSGSEMYFYPTHVGVGPFVMSFPDLTDTVPDTSVSYYGTPFSGMLLPFVYDYDGNPVQWTLSFDALESIDSDSFLMGLGYYSEPGGYQSWSYLANVVAPNLKTICSGAFAMCHLGGPEVQAVEFPSLTALPTGGFADCTVEATLRLPAVETVAYHALVGPWWDYTWGSDGGFFNGGIVFGSSCEAIEEMAFEGVVLGTVPGTTHHLEIGRTVAEVTAMNEVNPIKAWFGLKPGYIIGCTDGDIVVPENQ